MSNFEAPIYGELHTLDDGTLMYVISDEYFSVEKDIAKMLRDRSGFTVESDETNKHIYCQKDQSHLVISWNYQQRHYCKIRATSPQDNDWIRETVPYFDGVIYRKYRHELLRAFVIEVTSPLATITGYSAVIDKSISFALSPKHLFVFLQYIFKHIDHLQKEYGSFTAHKKKLSQVPKHYVRDYKDTLFHLSDTLWKENIDELYVLSVHLRHYLLGKIEMTDDQITAMYAAFQNRIAILVELRNQTSEIIVMLRKHHEQNDI